MPVDLSEAELMEMFTEVMSIMLFNDEQCGGRRGGRLNRQYAGTVSQFDLRAKLKHPSDLVLSGSKRRQRNQH